MEVLRSHVRSALFLILLSSVFATVTIFSHLAYSDSSSSSCEGNLSLVFKEDFEGYQPYVSAANWSLDWVVLSPGYGLDSLWVGENFQRNNRYLKLESFCNNRALVERNLTLNSSLISIGFKVRLREKDPCAGDSDSVAFSLGLRSCRSRIPLVELGTRENQTVLPFNEYYRQDAWIPFRADVDLASGETSVYQWDNLLGEIDTTSTRPSSINSLYIRVGGGSRHEARVDEIMVTECEVSESVSILAMLMTVIVPLKILVVRDPNPY